MSRLAATLLCACAALPLGCAENQDTLIVLFVPSWGDNGECVVATDTDPILFGLLDVAFETPYLMPAVLLNNSSEQAVNDNNTGVVSNEIQLKDAEVTIDSPQAPDVIDALDRGLTRFTVPLSTNSVMPGEEVGVAVEVLPLATVQALRANFQNGRLPEDSRLTVRANVVFNATRGGNDVGKVGKVKARDFSFPIQLCQGCLFTCAGCDGGTCAEGAELGPLAGGVCGNAQDFPLYPASCDAPE